MIFEIADGSSKNIQAGSRIACKPGYLPVEFDNVAFEVVDITDGMIMAQLEPAQLSAVSPNLILEVV